jgi:Sec-independent protein secretion pathway component TatC
MSIARWLVIFLIAAVVVAIVSSIATPGGDLFSSAVLFVALYIVFVVGVVMVRRRSH